MWCFKKLSTGFAGLIFLVACDPSAQDTLSRHQQQVGDLSAIENLTTRAECKGPDGGYVTQTASDFRSDYLLFQQSYSYRSNPFNAVIYSKEDGIGLDSLLQPKGSLSKPVIGVLRAHEFHELMLQPESRFQNWEEASDTLFFEVKCRRLKARDPLDLPVSLYFNSKTGLMEGFAQVNPYKKSELIQIHFFDWEEQSGVMMFDKLTILQGTEARFSFDYQRIEFNSPDFEPLLIDLPQ